MDSAWLWEVADKLRTEIDLTSNKEQILQLLILKHISSQSGAIDLAIELFEPRKLHDPLQHLLAYYQFNNGGMSNDKK